MNTEEDEFNRIEREAAMRKEAAKEPMTKDEALKLALEALEKCTTWHLTREQFDKNITAIKVIKLALAAPVREPVAFKIYKPTSPRGAIPNVRDAELPWMYDQDPSSGNVASMWVTPVQTLRSKS